MSIHFLQRRLLLILACCVALFGCGNEGPRDFPEAGVSDVVTDGGARGQDNVFCEAARRVASGATLSGESTVGASVTSTACLGAFRGAMRFYAVEVPGGQMLEVTAASSNGATPIAVRLFDDCEGTCLAAGTNAARAVNAALSVRTLVVGLGGMGREAVTFDARFTTRPIVAGESCATPATVPDAMRVRVTDPSAREELLCDGTPAHATWHRLAVPAGMQLTVRTIGAATARLRVSEGCAATTCLADGVGALTIPRGDTQRTLWVASTFEGDGPYELEFVLANPPTPATCRTSGIYRESAVLAEQSLSGATEVASDCGGSTPPATFYRVTLRPHQRVVATTNDPQVALRVVSSCEGGTCLAGPASVAASRTTYANGTNAEQTVVVAASARFRGATTSPFTLTLTIADVPAAAACDAPPVVDAGSTISAMADDATLTAPRCDGTMARTLFYAVDVPAGRRLKVTGTRETAVSLLASCASRTCVGAHWTLEGLSEGDAATWVNPGPDASRRIVALSSRFEWAMDATLSAQVEVTAPAPEGQCATAPPLLGGATVTGLSTQSSDQTFPGCGGVSEGAFPALWWRVVVPAGRRVEATMQANHASSIYDHGLAFVTACAASSCLASATGPTFTGGPPLTAAWTNLSSEDRTVYLAVFGPGSPIDLSLTFATPAVSAACSTAREVTPEHGVSGQSFLEAADSAPTCAAASASTLPAMFYRVSVPAGQRLDVTVTSVGAEHAARILSECASVSCLAVGSPVRESMNRSVIRWTNGRATAQTVVLAVSRGEVTSGLAGAFDLSVTLSPSPVNARCATPTVLTAGVGVEGSLTDAGDDAVTCAGGPSAPALYYSITVPAGQRLETRITDGLLVPARVVLLAACGASACLGTFDSYTAYPWWTNTSGTAQTVWIAVSAIGGPGARFTLVATLATPAAHGVCASALAVTGSTTLRDQRIANGLEPSACSRGRGALFYRVTVPARQRVVVRREASLTFGLSHGVSASCASAGCLAMAPFDGSSLQWANSTASPVDVLVSLWNDESASLAATADLSFTLEPVASAGICASAPTLSSGVSRVISLADAGESAPTCGGPSPALPTLFHRITVPAGQLLTVTLASDDLHIIGLRILPECSTTRCLTTWDIGSPPAARATWRNADSAPQTVYVATSIAGFGSVVPTAMLTATLSP